MDASGWRLAFVRLTRRLWFRLAAFAVGAVAVALLAGAAGSWPTSVVPVDLGQGSVQTLLQILATSMLAVTTFSLTVMVSVYASAASVSTPRATQLLVEDQTSQHALATFLGAFVYSIVGIAALSTGYYGEDGRIVLYAGTLVVIALVVITLLRWIQHLVGFGRMADVLDRVERAACDAATEAARRPHLGGLPPVPVPATAWAVEAAVAGVVTRIDLQALSTVAERCGGRVHVLVRAGAAVARGEALARVERGGEDEHGGAVRRAFLVERHRTYDQDPRLGMVALGEIGSRALSPSTNDPGTAIEALNAIQRVLTAALTTAPDGETAHARVHVPSVALADLVEDGVRPIARDGAALVEVGLRVQRVLGGLLHVAGDEDAAVLREASRRAERRAAAGLSDPGDVALVGQAAARARGEAA
ncbi:DUF2254 domain-containing protein [Demequina sp. SYSU T00192]|uniref:DUF2254 domain-containing protein n=1 Tax=Demequina litoralis TaxID=3051660 RepID=A0ABT8G5K3_9MICO|nr:DUF2254 domain-containing protein [Demequina sp. SYSU T00192]MDN4474404.1 DUF2254 domain-containing protein [Demequina sp. SYSU T00192]